LLILVHWQRVHTNMTRNKTNQCMTNQSLPIEQKEFYKFEQHSKCKLYNWQETSGARIAYPSGIHEFISGFCSDFVLTLFGFLSSVLVNCVTDRNNHVSDHGPVKECNVKLLSYYNIAITTKSTMTLNIVRRYQKNDSDLPTSCSSSLYLYVLDLYLTHWNIPIYLYSMCRC
jgi:hypothetical protein